MPKAQRKPEEIEAVKEEILEHAVDLITKDGYDGFSMRKLAARIGVSAKTIYNYYQNKDALYLSILTRGFERLTDSCRSARDSKKNALDRIEAMVRAFLDFGLEQDNFYNLMFTWHVPKYNDYVGSIMESAARIELETALQVADLFMDAIKACADPQSPLDDETARFLMITFWIQIHGYIAGCNNTLLYYMHADPLQLKDRLVNRIKENFRLELNTVSRQASRPKPMPAGRFQQNQEKKARKQEALCGNRLSSK